MRKLTAWLTWLPVVAMVTSGASSACRRTEPTPAVAIPRASAGTALEASNPAESNAAKTTAGFVWEERHPQGQTLEAVWGSAPDDVWAVGQGGSCVHFDGRIFRGRPVPTSEDLAAVWGTGPKDVWAAGMYGVFHWDGASWARVYHADDMLNLAHVWGRSRTDVWAVGGFDDTGSVVLHFDGARWSRVETPFTESLRSVWGTSGGGIAVFGPGGVAHTYDGKAWHDAPKAPPHTVRAVPAGNGLLAINGDDKMARFDGTTWSVESTPLTHIEDLWTDAAGHAWIVGGMGEIAGWDGRAWAKSKPAFVSGNDRPWLKGVFGFSPADAWAVGNDGTLVHYDGRIWSELSSGPATVFHFVAGTGAGEIFAGGGEIGRGGDLLRRKGTRFERVAPPQEDERYFAMSSTGTGETWLAGSEDLYRSNGSGWTHVAFRGARKPSDLDAFHDVLAVDGDVFAVGWNALLHLQGDFTVDEDMNLSELECVWGAARDDVWVAGARGLIRHFDGQKWSDVPPVADAYWNGIWGTARDDVWFAGVELTQLMGGAILAHFDGKNFSIERPARAYGLLGIFGGSRSDVWAVGNKGTVVHFDGNSWSTLDAGVTTELRGGLVEPDGTVWLAGRSTLLRRPP